MARRRALGLHGMRQPGGVTRGGWGGQVTGWGRGSEWAGEVEGRGGAEVGAGRARVEVDGGGFGGPGEVLAGEGEAVGVEVEVDGPGLAGIEGQPGESRGAGVPGG